MKGAATDVRYFARSKFSRSLVHKKNVKRGTFLSFNELGEKSRETIILGKFTSKPNQTLIGLYFSENVFHWSKFKARSHDVFFS